MIGSVIQFSVGFASAFAFGVRWQSVAATPLSDWIAGGRTVRIHDDVEAQQAARFSCRSNRLRPQSKSGVALSLPTALHSSR